MFPSWLTQAAQSQSLKSRILNDPYYRFQTIEELEMAAKLAVQIDANQAEVDDWLRLPGISIHQARTLVDLRQSGVPFHALDDVAAAIAVPIARIQSWELVLKFRYYDANSIHTIQPVNANTASVEGLLRVPGIDLHLARAIVANRSTTPYRNLSHLQRRLSLSPDLTAKLLHYLKF